MNSVQLHLALTHVPVVLSLVGLVMLLVAFFTKNATLTKTAYVIILVAGVAAIPVFFTGEGAEEAVERLPGVSEAVIEKHEDVAKIAMFSIAAGGLLALAALLSWKLQSTARILKVVVLLVAMATGWLMVQTAHLGGQIRHTELRSGAVVQHTGNGAAEEHGLDVSRQQEAQDDD